MPQQENVFASADGFYVDPDSAASRWVAQHPDDPRAAAIRDQIAAHVTARWFGDWNADVTADVHAYVEAAFLANKVPTLVAYNINIRDLGGLAGGGAGDAAAYRDWLSRFAAGIGDRPAIVVLEPDAIMQADGLDAKALDERLSLFRYAATLFAKTAPRAWVYLDAGTFGGRTPAAIADLIHRAGISHMHGFSLNVSSTHSLAESQEWGRRINASLQRYGYEKPFLVDTSRSGNGAPDQEWCDPLHRKIGQTARLATAGEPEELIVWVKPPGEGDGCRAKGGEFSPALAYELILGE